MLFFGWVTMMYSSLGSIPPRKQTSGTFNEHDVSNRIPVVQPPSVEEVLHDDVHKIPKTVSKMNRSTGRLLGNLEIVNTCIRNSYHIDL
jgi:hypothetical protein